MQGWATWNFLRGRTTAVVLDSLVIKQGLLGSHGATHIVVQKFSWHHIQHCTLCPKDGSQLFSWLQCQKVQRLVQ